MKKIIKNILIKIEKNGFEAYIVGGFVRDFLIGQKSFDIDICTNATPKELQIIFPNSNLNFGGISFKLKKYNFEITTYREEILYERRKPSKLRFINDVKKDLTRRDFTINTILMNKKGIVLDYLNGIKDLKQRKIKVVGDATKKLEEDPLRILRAIRLATVLNFKIDSSLKKIIKEKAYLVKDLSNTRIKEELDKILLSNNVLYGLELLKELKMFEVLKISYQKIIPVNNIIGMYAQINEEYNLPFNKLEKKQLKYLKEILAKEKIDSKVIYKYGLELSLIAGLIKGVNLTSIRKLAKKLPIKSIQDIKITPLELLKVSGIEKKHISLIMNELENLIISGKITNTKKDIMKYLKSR